MTPDELHAAVEALLAERRRLAAEGDVESIRWLRECGYGPPMQQKVNAPTKGQSFVATVAERLEREPGED